MHVTFCFGIEWDQLEKLASGKGGTILLADRYLYAVLDTSLCTYDVSNPMKGKVLSTVEARNGIPFLQLRLFGSRLCTNGRTGTLQIWDVSDRRNGAVHFYDYDGKNSLRSRNCAFHCLLQ